VVVAADPGREFAFARTEAFAGTVGWFIIDTLNGLEDRRTDLRAGMERTLARLAEFSESRSSISEGIGLEFKYPRRRIMCRTPSSAATLAGPRELVHGV
jgi:hypothetical protein